MADKRIGIALILSAYDKASAKINAVTDAAMKKMDAIQKKSDKLADASYKNGQQMIAAGVAAGAPVLATINAYSELEDAQLRLQSTMLDSNGKISASWSKINSLAIDLGNQLPGTTEDFYKMFNVMLTNGARAEDIINGTGRAAAYLANVIGQPYEQTAEFVQRLQESTGVLNQDMLAFMDTIARVKNIGVQVDEMQYAFSRSAGALKLMKVQGLQAMQQISPAMAMLVKTLGSGERVGTGISGLLNQFLDVKGMAKFNQTAKAFGLSFKFTDAKGNFLGIENMIKQFDKMKGLNNVKKGILIDALVGTGGDAAIVSTLIDKGVAGYEEMKKKMAAQADINKKVDLILYGIKNRWEAIKGTIVNVVAAAGEKLKPELQKMFDWINNALPKIQAFIEKHPKLVANVLKALGAFALLSIGGGALSIMFGGVFRAVSIGMKVFKALSGAVRLVGFVFKVVRIIMTANPIILIIMAIAVAAYLIYRNWGKITAWFKRMWASVKQHFNDAKKVIRNQLAATWMHIRGIFQKGIDWIMALKDRMLEAGRNIVTSLWNGIKAKAEWLYNKVKGVAQKIRDFFPFSPAKTGPLRDIHRIKLIETIASAITPHSMISAMGKTLSTFANASFGGTAPVLASAGSNVTFHYNPTIQLSGSATPQDVNNLATMGMREFEKLMRQYEQNKARRRF